MHSEHTAGPDGLPDLMTHAGRLLGADEVELYLVDYDQTVLLPLTWGVDEGMSSSAGFVVEKTLPGRAFRDMRQEMSSAADGWLVLTPVVDGTTRLGVISHHFSATTAVGDDDVLGVCRDAAALTAELVVTGSLYGDAVKRALPRLPMIVPAEMQGRLPPPLTFMSATVSIA